MKKNIIIIGFALIVLVILSILFFNRQTALVGIGSTYTVETEDFTIDFYTRDDYWEKIGCEQGAQIDLCNVKQEIVDYELECPVYRTTSEGGYGYTCPDGRKPSGGGYRYLDTCEGTNQCTYDEFCSKWCSWQGFTDWGLSGGAKYDDLDNCAWWVQVKDKQGNLVQEFSAKEKYGEAWEKDNFYNEQIKYSAGGMILSYVSDEYGPVQRRSDGSTIKDCIAIKFTVEDGRYKNEVCLGNDGLDEPGCDQVLKKTCKLTCNAGEILDQDSCTCEQPQLECTENLDCDPGFECRDNKCEDVYGGEEPPEEPPETPTNYLTGKNIAITCVILVIIMFTILFIRRNNP